MNLAETQTTNNSFLYARGFIAFPSIITHRVMSLESFVLYISSYKIPRIPVCEAYASIKLTTQILVLVVVAEAKLPFAFFGFCCVLADKSSRFLIACMLGGKNRLTVCFFPRLWCGALESHPLMTKVKDFV